MSKADMVNDYLLWKRDKDLYPPQHTPEEWAYDLILSDSHARMNLIRNLAESQPDLDPLEFANEVLKYVHDPLEELLKPDEGIEPS